MRILFAVLVGMLWLASCSSDSSDKTADAVPDLAVEESRGTDLVQEIAQEVADDVVAEVTPDIAPEVVEEFPPRGLPFEFKRTDKGDPVPGEETTAFTKKVTAVWEKAGWARWLLRTSTGVDPSTGKEDYLAWYNDVQAVKEGDTVTFRQTGGDHNMWISGSKILTQAMGGCSLTGDWEMCKLAQQYCKGLTASVKGFVWDENDPAKFLMARAVFPMDQEFTLDEQTWQDDGRKKNVVFCVVKNKSRLGQLVGKKTATCAAIVTTKKEDAKDLEVLCESMRATFNDNKELSRKWGGGIMGMKSQHVTRRREAAIEKELAKKTGMAV